MKLSAHISCGRTPPRRFVVFALLLCVTNVGVMNSSASPSATHVTAHKFYASLAQIDYNEKTKSLEVAMRVFADDLELALTKRAGRAVYLDTTRDVGKLARDYLQERFEVRGRDGKTKELRWVGIETRVDIAWLYFEIPVADGLDGAELRNRVLLEQYAEQVNTVVLKVAGRQRDFVFKIGDEGWRAMLASQKR